MRKIFIAMISMITLSSFASDLKVIGSALLEYSIFKIDVYQITYLKNDKSLEQLVLDYKVDVAKKHSIEGWKIGLKETIKKSKEHKEKLKWILDNTVDLKSGDKYIIQKEKNNVTFIKNGEQLATINDPIISQMVFDPWLGDNPIDKEIKQKLGGKK